MSASAARARSWIRPNVSTGSGRAVCASTRPGSRPRWPSWIPRCGRRSRRPSCACGRRARRRCRTPVVTRVDEGAEIIQRWQPVSRVGFYVPGGKAVYPSSVIMNVVPAQVAGVGNVVLVSPPQAQFDGGVHPVILAAAGILGVDEVYAIGGAGAIGALAYGVPDLGLEPVDVITGPGQHLRCGGEASGAGRRRDRLRGRPDRDPGDRGCRSRCPAGRRRPGQPGGARRTGGRRARDRLARVGGCGGHRARSAGSPPRRTASGCGGAGGSPVGDRPRRRPCGRRRLQQQLRPRAPGTADRASRERCST